MNTLKRAPATSTKQPPPEYLTRLLRLRPSRVVLGLTTGMHIAALCAVSISAALPLWLRLLLALLVAVHAVYAIRQWLALPNYRWQLRQGSGLLIAEGIADGGSEDNQPLHIQHCYYWSRWLVIFQCRNGQGVSQFMPFFYDCCSDDDFHRLRIIARYIVR